MRAGCGGCLTIVLAVVILVVGVPWLATGLLEEPPLGPVIGTPGEAARAERKLSALIPAPGGQGRRRAPQRTIALSESEVAAFLAAHLPDLAGAPLGAIRLRFREDGKVELAARTSVRAPLGELAGSDTTNLLPSRWLEQPLWLRLHATPRLERESEGERRFLRLDIARFYLGRRRLPAFLLRLFLDPTTLGLLRWPVPPTVDDLEVDHGRIVIVTRSSR